MRDECRARQGLFNGLERNDVSVLFAQLPGEIRGRAGGVPRNEDERLVPAGVEVMIVSGKWLDGVSLSASERDDKDAVKRTAPVVFLTRAKRSPPH